ncbi:hypothetical protein [Variovorax sp. LT1R16]|uniref:hypothetical protein n=1 Tax=Variovorax sp. LT1R16 TaxID=3443728 RepID=UPI003F486F4B
MSAVCTFAASVSMPQRMSVTPAANQTRVPARGPNMHSAQCAQNAAQAVFVDSATHLQLRTGKL